MPFAAASVISRPARARRIRRRRHPDRVQVQGDPDLGRARVAQRPGGQPVAEQQVVGGGRRGGGVAQPWRMVAVTVAVGRNHLRLVQRDPAGDPVAERLRGERGVLGEPFGRIAGRPAALVLKFLRQIPGVEPGRGRDAVLAEQTLAIRNRDFVAASQETGEKTWRIIAFAALNVHVRGVDALIG